MLRDRERIGEPGPFLSGQEPTHADFVLFAWVIRVYKCLKSANPLLCSFYPYSLTNPDLVKNVWRHADLPYINKWLDALFSTGLVSHAELLPYDG